MNLQLKLYAEIEMEFEPTLVLEKKEYLKKIYGFDPRVDDLEGNFI